MNEITLERLSKQIFEKVATTKKLDVQDFEKQLRWINFREFVAHNLLSFPESYSRGLMWRTFEFWKELNYEDWKYIILLVSCNLLALEWGAVMIL